MTAPAKQIAALRDQLNEADRLYRIGQATGLSDIEFDHALKQLEQLEADHPDLITPDSPTQRVGGAPIDGFETKPHSSPMLSIDNTYSREEFDAWHQRTAKLAQAEQLELVMEPKIDGVALSLRYEQGQLAQALTRGDGTKGDDITHNIKTVRHIPLKLNGDTIPEVLEVRGEIYLPQDVFDRVNADKIKRGEDPFMNPRNTTAGTLKQKDPRKVIRGLKFVAYGKGEVSSEITYATHADFTAHIKQLGLPVHEHEAIVTNVDQAWQWIENFDQLRYNLPFATDGVVIKVNDYNLQSQLGVTSKAPRWCIAYKFAAEQSRTKLLKVDWQVGKTGKLTPRATMQPVLLAGTIVSHATLHNADQIVKKDIRIGDTVLIEKAGEIIPQVVSAVVNSRDGNEKPIPIPKRCPKCETQIKPSSDEVDLRCPNAECPAQLRERLIYFVGRGQMDIDGLGPEVIDQLLKARLVSHFADLYSLDKNTLSSLTHESKNRGKTVEVKLGDKNAKKIIKSLEKSKAHSLSRVLGSLGIRHIGSSTAKIIASNFDDINALLSADKDSVLLSAKEADGEDQINRLRKIASSLHQAIHSNTGTQYIADAEKAARKAGVNEVKLFLDIIPDRNEKWARLQWGDSGGGRKDLLLHHYHTLNEIKQASAEDFFDILDKSIIGHSLYNYISSDRGRNTLLSLHSAGLAMKSEETSSSSGTGKWSGKTIVITGSFEEYTRSELKRMLESEGAKVTGTVTGKTDILLAGTNAGSKMQEAQKKNIKIASLDELNLVNNDQNPNSANNTLFGN